MKDLAVSFIVRDPDLARIRMLVEYMRPVADEFVFAVDDRTFPDQIEALRTIEGSVVRVITWRDDFAWARNQSLDMVTRPWTIVLDPDELPTAELLGHLANIGRSPEGLWGRLTWHKNWYCNEPSPESDAEWNWHLRVFQTGRASFYRPIHELVMLDGKEETETRHGSHVIKYDQTAAIIHSKPCELLQSDSAYYDDLSRRTGVYHEG